MLKLYRKAYIGRVTVSAKSSNPCLAYRWLTSASSLCGVSAARADCGVRVSRRLLATLLRILRITNHHQTALQPCVFVPSNKYGHLFGIL